jgi:uncharacterized cofD-like protein
VTTKIVAIGGGHGLQATVQAALLLSTDVTAIVSVADDGGSSGRLREEFNVLPPGDLRMALTAMAPPSVIKNLWMHRFEGQGALAGHSVGNLMLTALWQQSDPVTGLQQAAVALDVRGVVLPVSLQPHHLHAVVEGENGERVDLFGQAQIARCTDNILSLTTVPGDITAAAEALTAIRDASVILLGPGSWYTSVLAPLLVPGVIEAISESIARLALITNVRDVNGTHIGREGSEVTVADYIESLRRCAPGVSPSVIICDDSDASTSWQALDFPVMHSRIRTAHGAVHDPPALARTLRDWLSSTGA